MLLYRLTHALGALLLALTALSVAVAQDAPTADSFYFGVDLSYVNEMEDCGAVYRENGEITDVFGMLAGRGANLVRARLWHNPSWTDYSTLDDVRKTFTRARDAGMDTLLDIHYSDNWADAGTQEIPAAWVDLTDAELVDAVYDYTTEVLTALAADDLTPAFVQVGNETNGGILKRGTAQDWPRDATLFNAGIRAVRDFSTTSGQPIQVLLHVAQPENTLWWFSEAEAAGITDYDIIGVSYYPQWSTFSIGDMGAHVSTLRERFGKPVMVLETGYGWTRDDAPGDNADNVLTQGLRGYPFSPEGQYQFMADLTQSLISNGALGVVYWEPAWVSTPCLTRWGQGSHWENAALFDFNADNELLIGAGFLDSAAYRYPTALPTGTVSESYGEALVTDESGDAENGVRALDVTALYAQTSGGTLSLALTVAGDVFAREGSYLFYFDTTGDGQGATADVGRRPITVADPFQPEYRLDVSISAERASYEMNVWQGDDWEAVTFTGGASVAGGARSVVEFQLPLSALGDPSMLNIAVISTDRGRARSASDILGVDGLPDGSDEALVLDAFFPITLD